MLSIVSELMALIPIVAEYLNDPFIQLIVILSTVVIGLSQGFFLGTAILLRFPKLQNHLKTVSVSLFILFLINTVLSVPRFQSPEKIDITNLKKKLLDSKKNELFNLYSSSHLSKLKNSSFIDYK